jgi:hypothetical protein
MSNIEVVEWISYDTAKDSDMEQSVGGLGGFFKNGMRYQDYADTYTDEGKPYIEALRQEILGKGIKHGGDWHQEHERGVPVFSDGTYATFSYRGWGDLLAAIWAEEEGKDYCYMDFYMSP